MGRNTAPPPQKKRKTQHLRVHLFIPPSLKSATPPDGSERFTDQFVLSDEAAELSPRDQLAPLPQNQLGGGRREETREQLSEGLWSRDAAVRGAWKRTYLIVDERVWRVLVTAQEKPAHHKTEILKTSSAGASQTRPTARLTAAWGRGWWSRSSWRAGKCRWGRRTAGSCLTRSS